jgi:hypothetical protein
MRFSRPIALTFLILIFSASVLSAADLDYPYGRFRIKLPPSEDPFPGLGNYYTTLSKGMKSALWNPASLGKLKLSEISISTISPLERYNYDRTFDIKEPSGEFDLAEEGASAQPGGTYGIFFRYPQDIGPGIPTKEIEAASHSNYASVSTGLNFSSALKVNDWITVGFSAGNPLEANMDIAGDFPFTARATTNLYGQKLDQMQITTNGSLEYTYTGGAVPVTYESGPVWSGFLSQEATIPLITFSEFRNNLNVNSPFTGTIASKFGKFYVGLNMIPIYATTNIANDARSVVSADTQNIYFYTPDFDPNNETEISNWVGDPAKYGSSEGYLRKEIVLPAGEVVGTAKYRGFYSASAARFDIGTMYDVTDWLTVGLVIENATGSSLNFKGNGIAAFMNYRDIDTSEAEDVSDLLQPGGRTSLDLVTERWVTTFEVNGTNLSLEPEKTYDLPKKLRYGIALKKPFLILIDYEQNQTPVNLRFTTGEKDDKQTREVIIRDLNLLRIGMETQFFALPLWLRSGMTLLSKPSVRGLEPDEQKNFDDAFQYGFLPIKFDLGSNINAWGTIIGGSLGFNAQTLLNLAQFDVCNMDLNKLAYYNTYVARDAWQVNYLAQVDPFSTGAAYGNKTVPAGEEKQFEFSDVKFIHTLGITYRF